MTDTVQHLYCHHCGSRMKERLEHQYVYNRQTGKRLDEGWRMWQCPKYERCQQDCAKLYGECLCVRFPHDSVYLDRIDRS